MGGESEPLRAEFNYANLKLYLFGENSSSDTLVKSYGKINRHVIICGVIVKSGMTLSAMSADILCPARKLITRKINRTFWGRIEEPPRGI